MVLNCVRLSDDHRIDRHKLGLIKSRGPCSQTAVATINELQIASINELQKISEVLECDVD